MAILCGGKGTRIAALANGAPKALVPVAGTPFIDHQLAWLRSAGAARVVLLTGYRGDLIRDHVGDGSAFGLEVSYSEDGAVPLGTAGAIRRALPVLGDAFLTVYGDALLKVDPAAVADALERPWDGVMTVFANADRWVCSNVRIDGDRIVEYDKKAPPGTMTHIDYGLNAFFSGHFAGISGDRPVDLAEVHRALIERGTLRAFTVTDRFYEIGTPEGLAETDMYVRSRL